MRAVTNWRRIYEAILAIYVLPEGYTYTAPRCRSYDTIDVIKKYKETKTC